MIVTVSGLSGLTNAYRSVLSAAGSPEMSGASRWLEASTGATAVIARSPAAPVIAIDRLRDISRKNLPGFGLPGIAAAVSSWASSFGSTAISAPGLAFVPRFSPDLHRALRSRPPSGSLTPVARRQNSGGAAPVAFARLRSGGVDAEGLVHHARGPGRSGEIRRCGAAGRRSPRGRPACDCDARARRHASRRTSPRDRPGPRFRPQSEYARGGGTAVQRGPEPAHARGDRTGVGPWRRCRLRSFRGVHAGVPGIWRRGQPRGAGTGGAALDRRDAPGPCAAAGHSRRGGAR